MIESLERELIIKQNLIEMCESIEKNYLENEIKI
jgi:hypothetical protein